MRCRHDPQPHLRLWSWLYVHHSKNIGATGSFFRVKSYRGPGWTGLGSGEPEPQHPRWSWCFRKHVCGSRAQGPERTPTLPPGRQPGPTWWWQRPDLPCLPAWTDRSSDCRTEAEQTACGAPITGHLLLWYFCGPLGSMNVFDHLQYPFIEHSHHHALGSHVRRLGPSPDPR